MYEGLLSEGNIDLDNRPNVDNGDGTYSTVRTMTFEDDKGRTILVPTVINGEVVSDDDAIKHYRKTGEHMGIFSSQDAADKYDQQLHKEKGWVGENNQWANQGESMDDLELPVPSFSGGSELPVPFSNESEGGLLGMFKDFGPMDIGLLALGGALGGGPGIAAALALRMLPAMLKSNTNGSSSGLGMPAADMRQYGGGQDTPFQGAGMPYNPFPRPEMISGTLNGGAQPPPQLPPMPGPPPMLRPIQLGQGGPQMANPYDIFKNRVIGIRNMANY